MAARVTNELSSLVLLSVVYLTFAAAEAEEGVSRKVLERKRSEWQSSKEKMGRREEKEGDHGAARRRS